MDSILFKNLANFLRLCPDASWEKAPYAVLVGDVGSGKSTILEKLTGLTGKSSSYPTSFTNTTELRWVADKSMYIADTPGANPISDKVQHNMEIAQAFNFKKVSKVFLVCKADTRIDKTVDDARKYSDRFVSLPDGSVAVLITHMDEVKWSQEEAVEAIDSELGIDKVAFSGLDTTNEELLSQIFKICGRDKFDLSVTGDNFLTLFKINNSNRKILQITNRELKRFNNMKLDFDREKKDFDEKHIVDLYFEFQAYMTMEIDVAQQRMIDEMKFDLLDTKEGINQAGHLANMVNQLKAVLYDVRMEALKYQSDHGCSDVRKCPHCGIVWAKIEGCDGQTTCGSRPSDTYDVRDSSFKVLCKFTFQYLAGKLRITKNGTKQLTIREQNKAIYYGCGKSIRWSEMARAEIPKEFSIKSKVSTNDVKLSTRMQTIVKWFDEQMLPSFRKLTVQ